MNTIFNLVTNVLFKRVSINSLVEYTDVSTLLLKAIISPIYLPLSQSILLSRFLKLHSIVFLVYEVAFFPTVFSYQHYVYILSLLQASLIPRIAYCVVLSIISQQYHVTSINHELSH